MNQESMFLQETTRRDIGQFIYARRTGSYLRASWTIHNKRSNDILGRAQWHADWRQYVLTSQPSVIWSSGCLRDVARFFDTLKREETP